MGCNCGKGQKQQAAVAAGRKAAEDRTIRPAPISAPNGAHTHRGTSTTSRTQSFTLVSSSGRTQTFGSELEAKAALVRQGGRIVVQ